MGYRVLKNIKTGEEELVEFLEFMENIEDYEKLEEVDPKVQEFIDYCFPNLEDDTNK